MSASHLFKKYNLSVIGMKDGILDILRLSYYGLSAGGITGVMKIVALETAAETGMVALLCMDDIELLQLDAKIQTGHDSSTYNLLLDHDIHDWKLSLSNTLSEQYKDIYRLRIEHDPDSGRIWMGVTSKSLSGVLSDDSELPAYGLYATLQIRQGMPSMAISTTPEEPGIYILAVPAQGLHVYPDSKLNQPVQSSIDLYNAGHEITSNLYSDHDEQDWLNSVRRLFCMREIKKALSGKNTQELRFEIAEDAWRCRIPHTQQSDKIVCVLFYKNSYLVQSVMIEEVHGEA